MGGASIPVWPRRSCTDSETDAEDEVQVGCGSWGGAGMGGRASRGNGSRFCIQGFAGFQLATYCIEKYSARLKNYFPKQNAGIHQEARGVQCEQFTFVKYHMAAGRKTLTCFNSTAGVGLLYSPCRWL